MDTDTAFTLAQIREAVDAGAIVTPAQVIWLLSEVDRHRRCAEGLDLLVAEKESQLRQKESDYTGVCLEFADLNDELTRVKQDLELARRR